MFALIRKSQVLFSVGQFDHASGRVVSLEMVVSVTFGNRCFKSRVVPSPCFVLWELSWTGPLQLVQRRWMGHDAVQWRGFLLTPLSFLWLCMFSLLLSIKQHLPINNNDCTRQGVNNNAPMRVGIAPENYNTTGGYALYPGNNEKTTHFLFLRTWLYLCSRRCICKS